MPLRPSRRLPKAFQRTVSPLSLRVARSTFGKKRRHVIAAAKLKHSFRGLGRAGRVLSQRLRLWFFIALIVSLLLGFLFVMFSSMFTVSSIRVSRGDRRIDGEEIQMLLAPEFGKHLLFISPLLIARNIQEAYPEMKTVAVRRLFPDELHISLTMDRIAARVLLGGPEETEANAPPPSSPSPDGIERFVTEGGIYLEYPFPLETSEPLLTIHVVDWATKPEHRQPLLQPAILQELLQAKNILEQTFGASVPVVTFFVRALEFHIQTKNPGLSEEKEALVLWFDLASPLLDQINRYRDFLRTVPAGSAKEYVDLRLRDRVVYR